MKCRLISILASALAIVCLFSACQSAPANPPAISADPAPLSSSQLKDMQKEYPVCSGSVYSGGSSQVSLLAMELRDCLKEGDKPIYAQVSGKETTQSVDIADPANERENVFDYFKIPIRVLNDPSGKYAEGDELILYGNIEMRDGLPALEEGSCFVGLIREIGPGIHQQTSDQPLVSISEQGFYYVTGDGHTVAAYEEPEYFQHNGVGLATLLKEYEALQKTESDS